MALAEDTTVRTERPSGEYQVVRLYLSHGLRHADDQVEAPQFVHLTFRGEQLVNWWFAGHGWEAMHQHSSSLKLKDDGLNGKLSLRMYDLRGRLQNTADLSFYVNRSVDYFDGIVQFELAHGNRKLWESLAYNFAIHKVESNSRQRQNTGQRARSASRHC